MIICTSDQINTILAAASTANIYFGFKGFNLHPDGFGLKNGLGFLDESVLTDSTYSVLWQTIKDNSVIRTIDLSEYI